MNRRIWTAEEKLRIVMAILMVMFAIIAVANIMAIQSTDIIPMRKLVILVSFAVVNFLMGYYNI